MKEKVGSFDGYSELSLSVETKTFFSILKCFKNLIIEKSQLPWLKRTFWSVFLPKKIGRVFQKLGRMLFPRQDISIIRPEVCLDNTFAIQYQNTRPDFSDNLVVNLYYMVCKLCSTTIRQGIYDTYRNKNQVTRTDTLNYPAG